MATKQLILDQAGRDFLTGLAHNFESQFNARVVNAASGQIQGAAQASVVTDLLQDLKKLAECASMSDAKGRVRIEKALWPVLKLVVVHERRRLATEIDIPSGRTLNPEIRRNLQRPLADFDEWMSEDWFQETTARRLPRLTDLLTLELAERALGIERINPASRRFDEKFHILQSPALFLGDLRYERTTCELRGRAVAVAYVDIDDFKTFNTEHSESYIDLHLLPVFMTALEGHVFGRGYAYRAGGDEYLVLLPNANESDAIRILDDLRQTVKTLAYPEVEGRTTVSIGLCVADVDCWLTNREIQIKANLAKAFAKQQNKDCVASYKSDLFRPEDLYVAAKDAGESKE